MRRSDLLEGELSPSIRQVNEMDISPVIYFLGVVLLGLSYLKSKRK